MPDDTEDYRQPADPSEPAPTAEPTNRLSTTDHPTETDTVVDEWWLDSMPGSPLGRDTEVWNYVYNKLPELKRRLRGEPPR